MSISYVQHAVGGCSIYISDFWQVQPGFPPIPDTGDWQNDDEDTDDNTHLKSCFCCCPMVVRGPPKRGPPKKIPLIGLSPCWDGGPHWGPQGGLVCLLNRFSGSGREVRGLLRHWRAARQWASMAALSHGSCWEPVVGVSLFCAGFLVFGLC